MPGKDAGEVTEIKGIEGMKQVLEQPGMRSYYLGRLKEYKYLTLRHRGYVYVMYGRCDDQNHRNQYIFPKRVSIHNYRCAGLRRHIKVGTTQTTVSKSGNGRPIKLSLEN